MEVFIIEPLELYGHIDEQGKIHIHNRQRLEEWARVHPRKNIIIKFDNKGKKRSLPQNRYYWGVVIKEITLRLRELGHQELDDDTVHEMMKIKFNYTPMTSAEGEVLEIPKSTTGMTTTQFIEYMDRIRQWAAGFLDIDIPDPNEKLTMEF